MSASLVGSEMCIRDRPLQPGRRRDTASEARAPRKSTGHKARQGQAYTQRRYLLPRCNCKRTT
eukprot:2930434-Alexandrium_andersonii.AAC.1